MDPEMILQQRCRCLVVWTARRLLSSGVSEAGTEMRGSTFSLSADFPQPSTSTYHDVMVLHPHVRWGSSSASALKDPKLQLQEAASLVNTLPGFRVVGSQIIGVDYSTKRKAIWGAGKIEELLREKEEMGYSALMVNVQMLAPMQQRELHSLFRVPIFDRYNIVLSIFKHYARTEEAHLQIQLAELPYIRQRLHYLNRARTTADILQIEKDDLKSSPDQLEALRLREQQLKKRLKEAVEERTKEMTTTAKMAPQIAVVGYTNAGKTSLVKRLTGAEGLKPEDRLFATLDSTSHTAKLPSGRAASFVDTVGFLSDLPTQLFAAFETTLAHVKHADVILHLRDMSHPHWPAQSEDVVRTLESIGLTEQDFDRVVTIDNKIDRCHDYTEPENAIGISCQTGQGLEKLIKLVDERVLQSLDCRPRRFRLNFSSPLISYLYREGLVIREPKVEEDSLVFDVFMTEAEMAQLKKRSVALKKK